jgi:hypothetical protein
MGYSKTSEGTNGSRIFPDIIIHHRGLEENLLAIEVKKSTSKVADSTDVSKLRALREQLKYTYALFLRFECNAATPTVQVSWVWPRRNKRASGRTRAKGSAEATG